MKKYVFLTEHLSGLTGSVRYVNNKCKLLREKGWDVVVFWNYNIAPVELEHIMCFDNEKYIQHELKFYPSWYSERGRNRVVERLVAVIGDADQIVIESSKLELAAWGEFLAKSLNCKHIIFVLTEQIKIRNKETFDFCFAKMRKKEFFTINESAVRYLFSNFVNIVNPEDYYWSASQSVKVEHYAFPSFDGLSKADYTITSFGRRKDYFPYMLKEIKYFILQHPEKKINLFFLGEISDEKDIKESLSLNNVNLVVYPKSVEIVPKQIFSQSDVVVATAGCAWLSYKNGGKTIAMNVNDSKPLGLLGYTTLDCNTNSGKYNNDRSLSEWLQTILVDKTEFDLMEFRKTPHTFDYQMRYVNQCDCMYIDSSKVDEPMTRHDRLFALLIRLGLFHVVEYFYYKRRGVKVIWR